MDYTNRRDVWNALAINPPQIITPNGYRDRSEIDYSDIVIGLTLRNFHVRGVQIEQPSTESRDTVTYGRFNDSGNALLGEPDRAFIAIDMQPLPRGTEPLIAQPPENERLLHLIDRFYLVHPARNHQLRFTVTFTNPTYFMTFPWVNDRSVDRVAMAKQRNERLILFGNWLQESWVAGEG